MTVPLTPAMFALLLALVEGERHGYALMADVERLGIRLGPGTLYRSLQRMRVDGLVEEIETGETDIQADRRAQRRRRYPITAARPPAPPGDAGPPARLVPAPPRRGGPPA